MAALGEGEDLRGAPPDVQRVGVGAVALGVAVAGGVQQEDFAAGRDLHPVQLDVAGAGAGEALDRGGQAEQLLERHLHRHLPGGQPRPLGRVGGQQLHRAAEQPGGGVVAAGDHGEDVAEHRDQAVLVVGPSGGDEVGDRVGAGVVERRAAPPLHQRREVGQHLPGGVGRGEGVAGAAGRDDRLGPAVEGDPVLLGHPEVVRHHHARQRLEQRLHHVPAVGQRGQPLPHERADVRLEVGDLARGEPARDQLAERRVRRRVLHHQRRLGQADGLDLAVRRRQALRGGERLRVHGGGQDVGVPGQYVVVPLRVLGRDHVVHRVVGAQRGVLAPGVGPAVGSAWCERHRPDAHAGHAGAPRVRCPGSRPGTRRPTRTPGRDPMSSDVGGGQ